MTGGEGTDTRRHATNPSHAFALRARWVLPMTGAPTPNGAVVISRGRIAELIGGGRNTAVQSQNLGDVVLMPGLINAHTHLELTAYAGQIPRGPLWSWLEQLIALRRAPGAAEREAASVRQGAELSLRAGVTCVVDISRTGSAAGVLADLPIRKVCCVELISGAADPPRNARELREQAAALRRVAAGDPLTTIGLSPHSPYTVTVQDLCETAQLASDGDYLVTMHLAETPDEMCWLRDGTGKVAEFRTRFGLNNSSFASGRLSDVLANAGLLQTRFLCAHGNYLDDADIRTLADRRSCIAYCPRATDWFGHANHPWMRMLDSGAGVCIGTDSLASNSSLSVLDELRFLHARAQIPPERLLALATRDAARALGFEGQIGTIQVGAWADLVAIQPRRAANTPYEAVLDPDAAVAGVWVGGRPVCVEAEKKA